MNKTGFYVIIAILVTLNIVTLMMFWGRGYFTPYSLMGDRWNYGGMGRGSMMHNSDDHNHSTLEFNSWEEMQEHMEKEHRFSDMGHKKVDYNKPVVETHKSTYDFGQIKRSDGIVSTVFEIENHGRELLTLSDISTSCGCTTAELASNELSFNEETELTVYFDPNFPRGTSREIY